MKIYLILFLLLFSSILLNAQVRPKTFLAGSTIDNTEIVRGGIRVDKVLGLPYRDTTYTPERNGEMVVRPGDNLPYIYLGTWQLLIIKTTGDARYKLLSTADSTFANANLTATGDRSHDFTGHKLTINDPNIVVFGDHMFGFANAGLTSYSIGQLGLGQYGDGGQATSYFAAGFTGSTDWNIFKLNIGGGTGGGSPIYINANSLDNRGSWWSRNGWIYTFNHNSSGINYWDRHIIISDGVDDTLTTRGWARANITGGGSADSTTFYTKYRSDTSRTNIYGAIALDAPLASPTFTGTVVVPSESAKDSSTKAANTKYVDAAVHLVSQFTDSIRAGLLKDTLLAGGSIIHSTGTGGKDSISLDGDNAAPGNWYSYKTNGSDIKGWYSPTAIPEFKAITNQGATYTATATDAIIVFTGTTATLTYPTAATGRVLFIVNQGSGTLTIPTTRTANATTVTTLAAGSNAQVVYDGTQWRKIN